MGCERIQMSCDDGQNLEVIIPILQQGETNFKIMSVICIVLTGGPCGGKSSSLISVKNALEESGYRVMTMPEVPTILMSNGAQFPGTSQFQQPTTKLLLISLANQRVVGHLLLYSPVLLYHRAYSR